jgi:Na+-translocating ferredoxin:NAD+ oxidoreductase RnfG subunit
MEWLQSTGTILILIASITTAIVTIVTNFGKPAKWVKEKGDQGFENKVVAVLEKVLPEMLYKHDLEVRDKYKADREAYLQDIKCEVLKSIKNELGAVSNLEEQYDNLQLQYETLAISAKDVLREKIMALYHKNKNRRQLEENEREALD